MVKRFFRGNFLKARAVAGGGREKKGLPCDPMVDLSYDYYRGDHSE